MNDFFFLFLAALSTALYIGSRQRRPRAERAHVRLIVGRLVGVVARWKFGRQVSLLSLNSRTYIYLERSKKSGVVWALTSTNPYAC